MLKTIPMKHSGSIIIKGKDYIEKGALTDSEFRNVIECITKSSGTKRKIKRILQG